MQTLKRRVVGELPSRKVEVIKAVEINVRLRKIVSVYWFTVLIVVESPDSQNSLFTELYKQCNQMSLTEIITDEKRMGEGKVRVVGFMENVARDACRDVFIASLL